MAVQFPAGQDHQIGGSDDASADFTVAGEEVARLFREHHRRLIHFLQARLGSRQDANEVAQEAYVRLLELQRPNAVGFLQAYLFRIAANLAVDRLRSRYVRSHYDLHDLIEADLTDRVQRDVEAAEEAGRFWESLRELPFHYRKAVIMNRIQDLSCEEIAKALGKTPRTVRRYIAHALSYCYLRIRGATPEQLAEKEDFGE